MASARSQVDGCRALPWVAPAAVAYEDQVAAAAADLARCAARLAAASGLLSAALHGGPTWCTLADGPVPALRGREAPTRSALGGTVVRVGAQGVTSVDPTTLYEAAEGLRGAADVLEHLQLSLGALTAVLPAPRLPAAARAAVAEVVGAPWAPYRVAEHLRGLARRLRAAAEVHAEGESAVQTVLRGAAALWGYAVGLQPAPLLAAEGAVAVGVTGLAGLATLGGTARVLGMRGAETALASAGSAAGKLAVRSGAVEVATTALSGVARAELTGGGPTLDPVPGGTAALARLVTGPAGRPVLTAVGAPVQQRAPRGVGDVMDVVAKSYDGSTATGLPGTDLATVTIQRLDRPDGSRSWVVAVPGTETFAMSGTVPTDMGTNLRLEAGMADTMSTGVLAAMEEAGIPADEPVTLAGHSQGGMVALSVAAAAAGRFTIGAVLTAGSPDVPATLPPTVPVIRMEHVEDGTARVDGAPTRLTPQTTIVTRALAEDGRGTPDWVRAHDVARYVETGRRVDRAAAEAPGSMPGVAALDRVLGGSGTTATTSQYVIRREVG